MVNAFPLAGFLRSTLGDFVSIKELKIMDSWEQDRIPWDLDGRSARELKSFAQNNFCATFQSHLMPFEFDYPFYDWSGLSSYKRLFSEPSYFQKSMTNNEGSRHFFKQILKSNKFIVA